MLFHFWLMQLMIKDGFWLWLLRDKGKWTSRENAAILDRTELNRILVGDSKAIQVRQNCIYREIRFTMVNTKRTARENTISDFWSLKPTERIMITTEGNVMKQLLGWAFGPICFTFIISVSPQTDTTITSILWMGKLRLQLSNLPNVTQMLSVRAIIGTWAIWLHTILNLHWIQPIISRGNWGPQLARSNFNSYCMIWPLNISCIFIPY